MGLTNQIATGSSLELEVMATNLELTEISI